MTEGVPGSEGSSRRAVLAAALLSFVLAALVRAPALHLPIEGDAVAYGALAKSIAAGQGYALDGVAHDRYPPLWPALLSVPVALGASVTDAVRFSAWILGALAAPLAALLCARLARGAGSPLLVGTLTAVHPSLVLFAGGLVPGSEALALDLVLGFAICAASPSRAVRALGAVCAALLPLVRLDALPFAIAAAALLWARGRGAAGIARLVPAALVLLPAAAWIVRTVALSGSPLGAGYAAHAPSLARIPKNLLVLCVLVLPAAGLVLLWPFVPRGVRALWGTPSEGASATRAVLLGAAAHLVFVAVFAGPTAAGEGSLAFSTGSLRFGAAAVPFVCLAGAVGLATAGAATARRVAGAAVALSAAASVLFVAAPVQRRLPAGPFAAGRLYALREAFRVAASYSKPGDWIALDLAPRTNQGVEVFLGDFGPPGRRVGVLSEQDPPRGLFPRPTVLDLADGLPKDQRVLLLTDRAVPDGPVYTAGGQGIFHRIRFDQWPDEPAPAEFTIHQVRRPR